MPPTSPRNTETVWHVQLSIHGCAYQGRGVHTDSPERVLNTSNHLEKRKRKITVAHSYNLITLTAITHTRMLTLPHKDTTAAVLHCGEKQPSGSQDGGQHELVKCVSSCTDYSWGWNLDLSGTNIVGYSTSLSFAKKVALKHLPPGYTLLSL